ncbi:DUF983 domain-containing protein [Flavobacteriaceae bacterium]|jgi:hypothetical protein|nr:DUF983 domain-containing protein [Flavobacteriaceae bacterium]MBT4297337.1 DUF983 domain-containing protein [Flavobacteriaceae bacterium]MBT5233372.1 DUF983 domain-containing protein [Flavobacteriaceae bacterium]MBT7573078.1 DUF983 domain-containing protein [Flavobacteriaceae bacterium]MDA9000111.1 DUF983 domain-containing protein [Flavobacteriaceae bacterium]
MKTGKLYSIFFNKCPRCNKGKFWKSNNPYYNLFLNGGENHSHCLNCDLKFEIEPGFFYGAMYISYGLGIGIGSLILIISLAVFQMKNILLLSLIIGISILILAPVNYFLSRLIWLNTFIDNKS